MVTVVALLAVLLLQPTREARANGGDPVPGEARVNGTAPAKARTRVAPAIPSVTKTMPMTQRMTAPRVIATQPAPESAAKKSTRSPRKTRLNKRRPRRHPKRVSRPERPVTKTQPNPPRHRPRSISEILGTVGKIRPKSHKAPTVALPARLKVRDIQGGMARVMGSARACGRRFSTSGRISVRVVVTGGTGRVASVSPKGTHASSLTGRCVARALRSAKFKPFARSRQSFYYTVILR